MKKAFRLVSEAANNPVQFTVVQDEKMEVTVFRFDANINFYPAQGVSLGTWGDIDNQEVKEQIKEKLES